MLWKNKNQDSTAEQAVWRKKQARNFHDDLEQALSNTPIQTPPDDSIDSIINIPSQNEPVAPVALEAELGVVQDDNDSLEDSEIQFLKDEIHRRVINKIDLTTIGELKEDELRLEIRRNAESAMADTMNFLNEEQRQALIEEVIDETFGCLLYTSPSPRDRQKSRMPSSA